MVPRMGPEGSNVGDWGISSSYDLRLSEGATLPVINSGSGVRCIAQASSNGCTNRPLRSFGSIQVLFGGMTPQASATASI